MKTRIGMTVTDVAHVGKYIVIELSENEVKLKRISTRKIITEKEEGFVILPMSLFYQSFVEINGTPDGFENRELTSKTSFYEDSPEYKRKEASGKILFDYLEQKEKKSSNNVGCFISLLVILLSCVCFGVYSIS